MNLPPHPSLLRQRFTRAELASAKPNSLPDLIGPSQLHYPKFLNRFHDRLHSVFPGYEALPWVHTEPPLRRFCRALRRQWPWWLWFGTMRTGVLGAMLYACLPRLVKRQRPGETVVAVHRVAWLARNACTDGQKILFTRFTKNLAADIAASLKRLCSRGEWERIEIINLDAWARRFLAKQGFALKLTYEDASRENFWEKALELAATDLNYPPEFIRGERDYVFQARGIEKCDDYLTASRVGRARCLNRQERKLLWPVFEEYRALLTERGLSEPADAFRAATRVIADRKIEFPYRAALVDEAQDFRNQAFRLIRAIVPASENDLFIVGDAHQRIYGHQVVLSRCGIDIRGRGRKLRINYRTTEELKNWAEGCSRGFPLMIWMPAPAMPKASARYSTANRLW